MPTITTLEITKEMRGKVLQFVKSKGSITNRQCRDLLGLGYDQAIRLFKEMVSSGELERTGKTTSVKYLLPTKNKK